jgi:hypothetical protein
MLWLRRVVPCCAHSEIEPVRMVMLPQRLDLAIPDLVQRLSG